MLRVRQLIHRPLPSRTPITDALLGINELEQHAGSWQPGTVLHWRPILRADACRIPKLPAVYYTVYMLRYPEQYGMAIVHLLPQNGCWTTSM